MTPAQQLSLRRLQCHVAWHDRDALIEVRAGDVAELLALVPEQEPIIEGEFSIGAAARERLGRLLPALAGPILDH